MEENSFYLSNNLVLQLNFNIISVKKIYILIFINYCEIQFNKYLIKYNLRHYIYLFLLIMFNKICFFKNNLTILILITLKINKLNYNTILSYYIIISN